MKFSVERFVALTALFGPPPKLASAHRAYMLASMCGRSSLHDAPTNVLARFSLPPVLPGFRPRYNIAPTQDQWTLALDTDGAPAATPRRWGLVPSWASDLSIGNRMINARAETLAGKPAWRTLLEERRCLVLADGYYEWMRAGRTRIPFFFHLTGHRCFSMAGLWDRWDNGGLPLETCTVITTEAGSRTSSYHHRMPVLLTLDAAEEWLNAGTQFSRLVKLMRSYDESDLECYEVSRLVNSPANDSPDCQTPAVTEQSIQGLLL